MPLITKIAEQKKRPNRRNIFLDGQFAFGVNLNVVARFHLRIGLELTSTEIAAIEAGEVRQECMDKGLSYLASRLHSRSELKTKLMRREFGASVVEAVLDELQRLGYVDDARFAANKAGILSARKHHGRRRALVELRKAGVSGEVASKALDEVYESTDPTSVARELALKQAPRLRKLDPAVAKRRLIGMLQRRGFDYEDIKPVVEEVLSRDDPD
jgi:regulatory protein